MSTTEQPVLLKKDYKSDQDIRWCPGCGDYAILNAVINAFTKLQKKLHETVIVSGIGCSSRFPYLHGDLRLPHDSRSCARSGHRCEGQQPGT